LSVEIAWVGTVVFSLVSCVSVVVPQEYNKQQQQQQQQQTQSEATSASSTTLLLTDIASNRRPKLYLVPQRGEDRQLLERIHHSVEKGGWLCIGRVLGAVTFVADGVGACIEVVFTQPTCARKLISHWHPTLDDGASLVGNENRVGKVSASYPMFRRERPFPC
jgi:hypothetical protein